MFTVHAEQEDGKKAEASGKKKDAADSVDEHGAVDYVAATLHAWN